MKSNIAVKNNIYSIRFFEYFHEWTDWDYIEAPDHKTALDKYIQKNFKFNSYRLERTDLPLGNGFIRQLNFGYDQEATVLNKKLSKKVWAPAVHKPIVEVKEGRIPNSYFDKATKFIFEILKALFN